MSELSLSRRRFLGALGAGAALLPAVTLPGFVTSASAQTPRGRILVLVELSGGNDGLNSVVPITDPAYRALRPEIGIDPRDALTLTPDTALHPALRQIADLWEDGATQIIEGVGYPDPNRSHFRSIEIWNAGMGAASVESRGWVSSALADAPSLGRDATGLVLGGDMGPLSGEGRFSALRDEDTFLETLDNLPQRGHAVRPKAASPLTHVLQSYESAQITGEAVRSKLEASRERQWDFPYTEIGEQLRTTARLLEAGVDVPVLKVVQDGYDTHDAQPFQHEALLGDLSQAIGAFARAMKDVGLWDDITVLTYSEFGRTARENASGGTDHGTAAPIFAVGGQVAGGMTGKRPSLETLVDGEMVHTTDYRTVYSAVLRDLWQISAPQFDIPGATPLQLLG